MQRLLNDDKLNKCYASCKATFHEVQLDQQEKIMKIVKDHYTRMMKMGVKDVAMAYIKGDSLAGLIAMNKFIEKNGTKIVLDMLKDMIQLYEENKENINKLCKCYLSRCDEDSIRMTIEIVTLVKNVMTIFMSEKVQQKVNSLHKKIKGNLHFALNQLSKRDPSAKKETLSKPKSTKKAKTA
jgi:hypothetical protein